MKIYTVHKKQQLPITVEEAWEFLSNPRNLKIITPSYMSFDIITGDEKPMFAGQIIQYLVTPILGIKTKWVSEITHFEEKKVLCRCSIIWPLRTLASQTFYQ